MVLFKHTPMFARTGPLDPAHRCLINAKALFQLQVVPSEVIPLPAHVSDCVHRAHLSTHAAHTFTAAAMFVQTGNGDFAGTGAPKPSIQNHAPTYHQGSLSLWVLLPSTHTSTR